MKIVLSYMIESQSYHRFSSMTEKKFFPNSKFFKPKFDMDPNFFPDQNFFLTKRIFGFLFFQTQNDVWREKTKLLLSKLAKGKGFT